MCKEHSLIKAYMETQNPNKKYTKNYREYKKNTIVQLKTA